MKPNADKPQAKSGSKPEPKDDLKSLPLPGAKKKWASSPDGLTHAEARKRPTQYGPNQIAEKKTNPYLKFLFLGLIPWMIESAVVLSGVVRRWLDFFVMRLLLLSNAVVGFWEEYEAGNAIAALKATLAVNARVNGIRRKAGTQWIQLSQ